MRVWPFMRSKENTYRAPCCLRPNTGQALSHILRGNVMRPKAMRHQASGIKRQASGIRHQREPGDAGAEL